MPFKIKLARFYQVTVDYLLGLADNRVYENTPLAELLADAEIYVDGMTTMRFHDMNAALAAVRAMILEAHPEAAADRYLKILEAGQIQEEDFFCHVMHKIWDAILQGVPAQI